MYRYGEAERASVYVGLVIFVGGILACIAIYGAYLTLWVNQATEPARLNDPTRIQRIYTEFNDRHEHLKSLLLQIDTTEQSINALETQYNGISAAKWDYQDRMALKSLQQSYVDLVTSYNSQCSQYNADWTNQYKADYVGIAPDRCNYFEP